MQFPLTQSKEWGEFNKMLPGRGMYHLFRRIEKGKEVWRALIVRQSLPFGLCWLSIARGPVFADGVDVESSWPLLFREIQQLAEKEKAVFVRVELPENSPLKLDSKQGWRKAHAHYYPDWTLKLDLRPSIDAILAQMKQKGRYNIKVALKNGVKVRTTNLPADVSEFYKILRATGCRDGFPIHDEAYFKALVKAAHDGDFGKLYVAEIDEEGHGDRGQKVRERKSSLMISALFATFYGDTATYYYGASSNEHRALQAPYLLQWEAILEAKKRGCEWYDFLGIAPPEGEAGASQNHPWRGITEFKEKFGGVRIKYPEAREFVFKPCFYLAIRLRKSFRAVIIR